MFLWRDLKTKDVASALKSVKTGSIKAAVMSINRAVNVKLVWKLRTHPARQRVSLLTVNQSATIFFECIGFPG